MGNEAHTTKDSRAGGWKKIIGPYIDLLEKCDGSSQVWMATSTLPLSVILSSSLLTRFWFFRAYNYLKDYYQPWYRFGELKVTAAMAKDVQSYIKARATIKKTIYILYDGMVYSLVNEVLGMLKNTLLTVKEAEDLLDELKRSVDTISEKCLRIGANLEEEIYHTARPLPENLFITHNRDSVKGLLTAEIDRPIELSGQSLQMGSKWFGGLRSDSKMISGCGQSDRIRFFKNQKKIITRGWEDLEEVKNDPYYKNRLEIFTN